MNERHPHEIREFEYEPPYKSHRQITKRQAEQLSHLTPSERLEWLLENAPTEVDRMRIERAEAKRQRRMLAKGQSTTTPEE